MPELYQTNLLSIIEINDDKILVDGGELGNIPLQETPEDIKVGDEVKAFVYIDSLDDVVATMAQSYVQAGECAYLKVISTGRQGTYLDWGLPKDLLLPHSEQMGRLYENDYCVVYVSKDDNNRPFASMRYHYHLDEYGDNLRQGQAVDLMIASETGLGFKAIINNKQLGLIYHDELSQDLDIGSKMKGWVKEIRDDGKINLNINTLDNETRDELEEEILKEIRKSGGRLNLSDKSSPDDIYDFFMVSKKNFKRALGSLYKQRMIKISPAFIEIIDGK